MLDVQEYGVTKKCVITTEIKGGKGDREQCSNT